MKILGREPAFWIGLLVTLIFGALQTLAGEGLVSDVAAGRVRDGVNAVAGLATLLAPLIAGLVIRQNVFSPPKTQELVNKAGTVGSFDVGNPPAGDPPPGGGAA